MKAHHSTRFDVRSCGLIRATWLVFAVLGPATTGQAQVQVKPHTDPLCALANSRYRVDFVRGRKCCPNVLEFWVEDLESGRQGRLPVETQIRQAGKMTLVAGSKILVTGLLERDAKAVAVVDLESGEAGELQDELHAFDYRLSPSQRYIVYSRRDPNRDQIAAKNQLLLLYDLAASREDNRAGQPPTLDISNAGRPVYPESNAREGSYDPKTEEAFRLLSPLLWSDDESRVVFFETFEERYFLVTLELSQEGVSPRIHKRELALADLASGEPPVPSRGGDLPIATLLWKDVDTVELKVLLDGVFHDSVVVGVP